VTAAIAGVFLVLTVAGMPLSFALGFASLGGLLVSGNEWNMLPQRMMHAVNSFPLMSIPFFMLAGELMIKAGIMERLVDWANSLIGRVRAGLAHATMVAAAILSTVSGSAAADASALAGTLVPALRKNYDLGFAAAVVAGAANLGPIIPPSGAMIVYAVMAGPTVSIGAMFMAGFVPGIIMAVAMMALCSVIVRRRGYAPVGGAFSLANAWRQTKRSIVIFMMPVTVIGGIVGGAFTATEASAIAVVYALVIGFFVTRTLRIADLPGALLRAAITSSVVGAMIAFASTVTFLLTIDLLPLWLSETVRGMTTDPFVFLLLVMALLFVVGCFMESIAAYVMLVPLFHPIALQYGLDPLYFGFLFVFNLVIGMLTPPVGVVLFVVCGATGISMGHLVRNVWPFIVVQYAVLFLCLLFPPLVTAVPRWLGY